MSVDNASRESSGLTLIEKKIIRTVLILSRDPTQRSMTGYETFGIRLPVTQSFVGCLRNVYINEVSVLYKLAQEDPKCTYNGGDFPRYGCYSVAEVPISFPRSSSLLRWNSRDRKENLSTEFKIRTFHHNCILMSLELVARSRSGTDFDFGSIQLWILNKFPILKFTPSYKEDYAKQNVTVPLLVSDGQLHDIKVKLESSKVKLQVDGTSVYSKRYSDVLESKGPVILGYSFDLIDRKFIEF
ncbi:contactin-associated protein-like 5 [Plakobranchus ocellatus]|uniref:Contactin-associated protein-like 5 n=1 Tax=Plakobranchus ocellatus TaxID=259542 RepID=A0AAV4BKH0_9GAST|nr:contactin-associated protein-like 5 [Plakobranchus ocellatus]